MPRIVGYNIFSGTLVLHNSQTANSNSFKLKRLGPGDVHAIEECFQDLKTINHGIIGCFCVVMDSQYNNDFRKKFVEITKKQRNIKNLRIIGAGELMLFGAILNLSFMPEIDDFIYILDCRENVIYCHIWKFNEEKQWNYVEGWRTQKEFKGKEKPPTFSDLQNLKFKLVNFSKTPYICVLHTSDVNQNNFKYVFSNHKKIIFKNTYDWATWALLFARYFLKENEYLKYKSDMILNKKIEIKTVNETYLEVSSHQILPFSKTIDKVFKRNDVLKIYEESIELETIVSEEDQISVTLNIDINGIYTIKIVNLEKINESKQSQIYSIPKKISDYNSGFHAVGIDLGTTECCAAVIRKKGPDFVVLDPVTGLRTMPSYIAFDEREPKCGQIVVNRMKHKYDYIVCDTKRIIGKDIEHISVDPLWPFKILEKDNNLLVEVKTFNGKATKTIEEITSNFLSHIKSALETYQNTKLDDVVIAIPSEFSEKQKQATKIAAEMAGWKNIHFIPEPVAAAFAYFTDIDIPNNSNILICDCGGGTTDICVAKVTDGKLEILSFDGDPYLGGRDFDSILFTHFSAILKHKYGFDVMKSPKKYLLKQKCQEIKHKLSVANEDWLDVDDFDKNIEDIVIITKGEFEEMSSAFIIKIKNVILRSVKNAKMTTSSINYVFQVGGGCRMPMIKEMLKEIFPNASQQCNLYPDWVVAHGATLYAYHLKTEIISANEQKATSTSSWFKNLLKK